MVLAGTPANTSAEVYSKSTNWLKRPLIVAALALAMAAMGVTVDAATFTVTHIADSGAGTLRQAIADANASAGPDIINFNFASPVTILLTSTELVITDPVTINGDSIRGITIDGNDSHRIFNIQAATTMNFLNLTRGRTGAIMGSNDGAAIHAISDLTLNNCAVYSNWAESGADGGGIYFTGTLNVNNSTISGNRSSGNGGGISSDFVASTANITDSTIAFNSSGLNGGGLHNQQGTYNVRNSIIAGNSLTAAGPDFSGQMFSMGYNIIGNTSGTTIVNIQGTDMTNTNPNLQPLALNGGATRTHAFGPNSAATDRGNPGILGQLDQRGTVRGTDGERNGVRTPDVGAYELQRPSFDFDGGRQSDLAVTRNFCFNQGPDPEGCNPQLVWYSQAPGGGSTQQYFGVPTDIRVPGDYDVDGITDIAVWRPSDGNFYVLGSANGYSGFHWGQNGDIPVPAEYNQQGITEYAIYRAGTFHIFGHISGYYTKTIGAAGDKPAVADYDGDSKVDVAVFNAGVWKIEKSTGGMLNINFGTTGDIAVPADYDGDGKANIAVFRPASGTWYILNADNQTFSGTAFGISTDKPVPADYDGDGKTDIAVFRSGTWYILNSRIGLTATAFGNATDFPVESSFIF
jgi:hypothetical protein